MIANFQGGRTPLGVGGGFSAPPPPPAKTIPTINEIFLTINFVLLYNVAGCYCKNNEDEKRAQASTIISRGFPAIIIKIQAKSTSY